MRGVVPVVWVAVAVMAAGCGREQAPDTAAESGAEERADAGAVIRRAAELMSGGETNAALDVLTEALSDPDYADERGMLLRSWVRAHLSVGRTAEAEEKLLGALNAEGQDADRSLGLVYGYYQSRGDTTNALRWARALHGAPPPERLTPNVLAMALHAAYRAAPLEDALALVPEAVAVDDAHAVQRILEGTVAEALKTDDHDAAAALLDAAEAEAGDRKGLRSFFAAWRIRLAAYQGDWEAADRLLRASAGVLDDRALRDCFRFVLRQAADGEAGADYANALAMFVLTNVDDKPLARRTAAGRWLSEKESRGMLNTIPDALAKLRELGFSAQDLFQWTRRWFYKVLGTGDDAAIASMLEFLDTVSVELEERQQAAARSMLLDSAFTVDDFARAAKMVDQGIPGRDEAWHKMAANKIRAHLAEKEGRTQEAIERFRGFMDHVRTWDDAQVDPSTGLSHTREMTLGRNARRIARLHASIGKTNEAAAAEEEARGYYEKALAALKPDSEEYALVKQEKDASSREE